MERGARGFNFIIRLVSPEFRGQESSIVVYSNRFDIFHTWETTNLFQVKSSTQLLDFTDCTITGIFQLTNQRRALS